MKIDQYLQCDWNRTRPSPIESAAMAITHRGATIVIPVGTDNRGYSVRLQLTLDDLINMAAAALTALEEHRKTEAWVTEVSAQHPAVQP